MIKNLIRKVGGFVKFSDMREEIQGNECINT